ncbi:signal transduction histidine kinase, nitrogen specific [Mizugakiibacter sediminis]|uniref:histidine kinase n=1 Tax=Mizugakiibacter sediminis TaxID=1475481 RepID=A0A0K8QLW9_9GAMM|nr:ATP-binding protein [Mizugakiibacter sediminis]GAP65686.1 signal transduction histidine kinase, nitrogen specific [Mizugakiibacter sediminis]
MHPHGPIDATPLLDQLATGVAWLDAGLILRRVNPGLGELVGVGAARLVGKPLQVLAPAEPALVALARRALDERRLLRVRDLAVCAAPGAEVRLDFCFNPLPQGLLLEAQPAAPAQAEAPRLSESLRGFAHEVRNPLAGVSGAAQLLLRKLEEPAQRALAELILTEAGRLAALTERLLGARGALAPASVNLHGLLDRLAALLGAERADLAIVRDYDPSLPAVRGDADRLLQLLLNLGRNAVEAGAARLVLRTRAEAGVRGGSARRWLRVEVEDDGAGVPAALEQTLFLPLVSGRAEGSGLGLALAREIAREHGGELEHQRRNGLTCFVLRLPVDIAEESTP